MTREHADNDKRRGFSLRRTLRNGLIIAVTGLVLFEVVLRVIGLARPVLYMADAEAGYRLRPSQHVRVLGNDIIVNQWGLRDPRPLDGKPDGAFRVLVLGDSVTWGGVRVAQEELFTSRLEKSAPIPARFLHPGRPAPAEVQVLNAGVNGYSVAQMVALYRAHLQSLEPDLILVYVIPADFLRPPKVVLRGSSTAFPTRRPLLALEQVLTIAHISAYRALGWAWLKPRPPTEAAGPELDEQERVRRNVEALVALADLVHGGAELMVVVSPFPNDPKNAALPEIVGATLAAHGIPWVNLNEHIQPTDELFMDHIHLSKRGHSRVAETLASLLTK